MCFTLHHWTALALLIVELGVFAFIVIADEVLETAYSEGTVAEIFETAQF